MNIIYLFVINIIIIIKDVCKKFLYYIYIYKYSILFIKTHHLDLINISDKY